MKTFLPLVALTVVTLAAPRFAAAGCPQVGGCNAVTTISATLESAPTCLRVESTETENGCVCSGSVTLANDCAFEISLPADEVTIPAGERGSIEVGGADASPGAYTEDHELVGDGQSFVLHVAYGAEPRELPGACAFSADAGRGASGLGLGLGLAVAALTIARRRAR